MIASRCRPRRIGALVLLTASSLLVGCGSGDFASTPINSALSTSQHADPEVSNVWHKSENFDPNSELGTFVRAYHEAMGLPANTVEARYPGTTEASKWQYGSMRTSIESDSYFRNAPAEKGTQDHYVVWAKQSGEVMDVGICTSRSRLALRGDDGKWYTSQGPLSVRASRMWITMSGTAPQGNVSGSATYPSTDVYGDWTVSRYDIVADHEFGQGPPAHRPTQAACYELLDIDPEAAANDARIAVDGEPVVEPNQPGWPAGAQL